MNDPGWHTTIYLKKVSPSNAVTPYPHCRWNNGNVFNGERESRSVMSDSLWPDGLYSPWSSPGQNTGMGSLSLLQGIFPSQGLNPGLLHYRRILYQLSHKGSPRILEWVAYPFPAELSYPGIKPGSPALLADSYQLNYQGSPSMVCYYKKVPAPWFTRPCRPMSGVFLCVCMCVCSTPSQYEF